jgi:hypothetical protein
MTEWTLSTLHQPSYGGWAGNPSGHKADPSRCCQEVYEGTLRHFSQCARKRGHGPEEAYCKQHSPEVVAARSKASREKWDKKFSDQSLKWAGPKFFAALCKIADGDNDPRQTALEAIKGYRE